MAHKCFLEKKLRTSTTHLIAKEIVPQPYPIRNLKNPIRKFRNGSPNKTSGEYVLLIILDNHEGRKKKQEHCNPVCNEKWIVLR